MPKTESHERTHDAEAGQRQVDRLMATVERLEAEFRDLLDAEIGWAAERSLLRAMIDQVPDYLFAKDRESRFLIVNKAVADIHGAAQLGEMIGKTDFDLHAPELARKFFDIEQMIVRSGRPMIDMEEVVLDPSGATKWLSTSKVVLRNEQNEIIGLVGISRDVTARKRDDILREEQAVVLEMIATNASLQAILNRLVLLMEGQLEGVLGSILLLDADGRRLRHGAAPSLPEDYWRAIDGVVVGPEVGSCGTAAFRRQAVIVADISRDPLWRDYRELAARHALRSCWSTPILSHDGAVLGTFAMYSSEVREPGDGEKRLIEITTRLASIAIERKRAEDRIHFLAHHDTLTGLPNRSVLEDRLTQAILHTRRSRRSLSVVFVDLDNFKTVNDSLGHTAGDAVLQVVASRMVACVRASDTVVRLGGDEFVILLVDQVADPDAISSTLNKLRAAIGEPVLAGGATFHVTCSMGVATFPGDGADAGALLMAADAAMYKAKAAGRDGFQFYAAGASAAARRRQAP